MTQPTFSLDREKLRQKIIVTLVIISYLPFFLLSSFPGSDSSEIIFYFARQTGYAAAVMLLWQYILGNRSVTKYWLKDQIWVLSLHKKLGIYGIVLILAHPLLIALDYSDFSLLYTPDLTTDFGRNVAFGRTALFSFLFIWVTSAVLRSKIGFRPWRYIHYLTYPILIAVFLHAPEIGTFYAGSEIIPILWNVMIVIFILVLVVRILHFFKIGQTKFTLKNKEQITEDVYLYTLKPNGKKLKIHPGQFIYLRSSIFSEEHPFSVAGYKNNGEIQVATKLSGKYTKKLANIVEGSEILVDGPYGIFTHEVSLNPDRPVTFIAGGIGITPFLPHIVNKTNKNITLFYANRTSKNIVLLESLNAFLGKKFINVLSEENNSNYKKGFVSIKLLKETLGDDFIKQHFYICGPPPMMKTIKASLTEAKVPVDRIHTEEFGY